MSDALPRYGRYQVTHTLGRGAMGLVYLADDPLIGRQVAVKVIRPEPGLDPEEAADRRARFEREFRAAGTLSHPNIVTVYDVGHEGETSFIAMEFVQGESLQQLMQKPLSVARSCELLLQIAAGLDFANQAGIIHRDVKPANILLSREGQAKITDFGVAKQASTTLTRTGTVLGTPAYMSPEQITGSDLNGASDQFSLAIIAYELLTRVRPFAGESAPTILYKIVQEAAPAPTSIGHELPPQVDMVFDRALAKNPAARFPTCVGFARALREALGLGVGEATLASTTGERGPLNYDDHPTIATDPGDLRFDQDPASHIVTGSYAAVRRTPRTGIAAVVAVVTVIAAGLGFFGWQRANQPPPVTTLTIETSSTGAAVFIDGESQALPLPGVLELRGELGGRRQIEVRRADQVIGSREITLDGGSTTWTVTEAPTRLALTVVTNPPGADVRVDGNSIGTAPVVADLPRSGQVKLELRLDGFRTASENLDLEALSAAPEARFEHTFDELPPSAQIVVEGGFPVELRARGKSWTLRPGEALPLEAGRLSIQLAQPRVRYRGQHDVALEAGQTTRLRLPRTATVQVAAQPGNCTVWIDGSKADVTPFAQELVIGSHDFEFRWADSSRRVTVTVREDGQRVFEALSP